MKKTLLFMVGGLLATANVFAQAITLNQGAYTSSQVRVDSFKSKTAASAAPSFAATTNATWDLTTMTDSTGFSLIYRVASPAISFADSNYYSFVGNAYQGNVMSDISAAGYEQRGIKIQAAPYVISGTDSIFILAQNTVFVTPGTVTPAPKYVLKFPTTMSTTWTDTYESDFDYELTYNAPLYVHAPGKIKSYITATNTVIGWGRMRVKTGAGAASGYMNVLQVRTQETRTDSFYLNGGITDPGLGTLLSTLGLTQGQVTKTYTQNFYRMDEVSPLASVTFSDSANTAPTSVTTHKNRLATPSAVANVTNENNVRIYPNPVTGRELSIDVAAANGAWSYELVSIAGQVVEANALQLNNGHAVVKLSAFVTPGIYYLRLANNGAQVSVKALDIK